MPDPILEAKDLLAASKEGAVFGPLDLTLAPRQICVVHGPKGSGKSALLLALTGRLREATGRLTICGIDAMRDPYAAMQHTAVARLGNYVYTEDRLTLRESIRERCYLDAVPLDDAIKRVEQIRELLGVSIDDSVEVEQLSAMEQAIVSVALVMLRPTSLVVIDDADLLVPHRDQPLLFDIFARLLTLDDAALVASTVDDDTAPDDALVVTLPGRGRSVEPTLLAPVPAGRRERSARHEAPVAEPAPQADEDWLDWGEDRAQPENPEPEDPKPEHTDPDRAQPEHTDPDRSQPEHTGQDRAQPEDAEPENADQTRRESSEDPR